MKIGIYEVVRLLGKGGMSEVYEVADPRLGSRLALKIYNYPKDDPEVRRRFEIEGRLLARLSHPGIVKVFDIGEDGDRPYFVMDLVLNPEGECQTLADVPDGSVDEKTIGMWYDGIRDALGYIHSQGVVHRDLKLQNVMVGPDGRAILADFGVSKIFEPPDGSERRVDAVSTLVRIRDGSKPVMGSLGYMAPELEMGVEATAKSDWYALGVIVYKLLTGTWCDSRTDIVSTLETYDPVWLEIIPKLLHSNPEGRECLSWADTKEELREKAEFKAEKRLDRERRRFRSARRFARAASLAALAISAVCVFSTVKYTQTRKRLKQTEIRLLYPTFDRLFKIPSAGRAGTDEDGRRGQVPVSEWEMAQVDAWFLTHKYFDALFDGKMTFNEMSEAVRLLNRKIQRGEFDDIWGDEYTEQGEDDEPLKEIFTLAMKRLAKAEKKLHARGVDDSAAPAGNTDTGTDENGKLH